MKSLPDPRTYAPHTGNPLALLAGQADTDASALQQGSAGETLRQAVDQALDAGDDGLIRQALQEVSSERAYASLVRSIEAALDPPGDSPVAVRLFAIPILVITGGTTMATIPGVLPAAAPLQALFESKGALGQARNFGLGNALVAPSAVREFSLVALYRMSRGSERADLLQAALPPADIALDSPEEQVHLRYIAGASVTPRDAPGFAETAGNIGAWGMAFTQELARQLAQPGLSLLPIPRPPAGFLRAPASGAFAQREIGLQLFLSGALRDFRSRIGEPDVRVAAHGDGSIRIRLTSRLDESLDKQYRWEVGPGDDFAAIRDSIFGLLAECRLDNVEIAESILPDPAAH